MEDKCTFCGGSGEVDYQIAPDDYEVKHCPECWEEDDDMDDDS